MTKRIEWIDIAKGIGIILVVIGHISQIKVLNEIIYSFHMPLFFMISGFLHKNKNDFIKHKVRTIIFPYIFFSIITFIYWFFIESKFRNQQVSLKYLINIFIACGGEKNYPYNAPMWFLPCLFMTEILFNILQKLEKKYTNIIIVILGICGYFYPKIFSIRMPFCLDVMMVAICFYYIGFMIRPIMSKINDMNIEKSFKISIGAIILMVLTVFLAVFENGANMNELKYNNMILFYLTAILGSVSIMILSMNLRSEVIKDIGKNSLIIMCIHEPVKRVIIVLCSKLLKTGNETIRMTFWGIMIVTMITFFTMIPIVYMVKKFFSKSIRKKQRRKICK